MIFKPRKTLHIIVLIFKYRMYLYTTRKTSKNLAGNHFNEWSDVNHINYPGFEKALKQLNWKPALIVETGTSAWGTDSTRLWDTYIRRFGGEFYSVDIRKEASDYLKYQLAPNSHLVVDDSISFLSGWNKGSPDLYYLDSWDLDLDSPEESAQHGKSELLQIIPFLKPGSLILIDDTPNSAWFESLNKIPEPTIAFKRKFEVFPGKGAFFHQVLSQKYNYEILHHQYSILIRIISDKGKINEISKS